MNTMTNGGLSGDIKRDVASMKTDMDKAREIASRQRRIVGKGGSMRGVFVAAAVAEGIALGRKEGIAMAAEAVPARA
jgi:hypothetical protein